MQLTIGQTIKKLRKERNLTQEELAEQLNVTFQAVSKWENDTGMPDISQVVPLASVFGVSTDVLFGTLGTSDNEEALKIIDEAYRLKGDGTTESLKCVYNALQEGLRCYPNNNWLLANALEIGVALAYPENDCHNKIHGKEIYRECIRQADLIISYSKNIGDVLRARMIMVTLHSAYGEIEKAWEHAREFPGRSDFTIYNMSAYIAHAEKNYAGAAYHWKMDFDYHLTAMLDDIILLGKAYRLMGKHDDALKMFFHTFSFMEIIYKGEKTIPHVPNTDSGDVYVEIARTYLEMNDKAKTLDWLEKMVDYDVKNGGDKNKLLKKLSETEFDGIKNDGRFIGLQRRANAMDG